MLSLLLLLLSEPDTAETGEAFDSDLTPGCGCCCDVANGERSVVGGEEVGGADGDDGDGDDNGGDDDDDKGAFSLRTAARRLLSETCFLPRRFFLLLVALALRATTGSAL